ncbi:flavodoxin family protein [Methanosphaera sp. WGK6]|uniref:flavodoxin family protein n=1 Tax=Methanosphaera sp. WGK6 TaxID=1561964 RepID=UPI00084CC6D3|nr:flavodoxin family protein [Methanosphaera sp. WGK6]OED29891.1 NADPH-dependent FMN reductase [Methanosphaera sp. WGK6]
MKVLLVNGSPREKGCTYTALTEIAQQLKQNDIDSEIYWMGLKTIRGCIACGACKKNPGKCVFDDDICNELINKMVEADGVVFGSPVYYASVRGEVCTLLDRVFYAAGSKFAGKPAAGIVSCRRGGSTASYDRFNKYFGISRMPIVSSQYWNGVHGNTPDEVKEDLEGLQIMRTLADEMAWLLKAIENTPRPEAEKPTPTNFIR